VCKKSHIGEEEMPKKLHRLSLVDEATGKTAKIVQIDDHVTIEELVEAATHKFNVPSGIRGVVVRKLTSKQLSLTSSLFGAGIEDNETLIIDFERTAGGHMEFYEDGGVKVIETTPEETPYLAEILREIRKLNQEIRDVDDRLNTISAEIKDIHNSIIVVSGNDTKVQDQSKEKE
jgi:hypothetical protein